MLKSDLSPLYWDASYEIALALAEQHPDAEIDAIGLDELYQWVIALPNFADEPALANEGLLLEIIREWYEEVSAR